MAKYTPHTQTQIKEGLKEIGVASTANLFSDLPDKIKYPEIDLADGVSEGEAELKLNALANKNRVAESCFMGAGCYKHYLASGARDFINKAGLLTTNNNALKSSQSALCAVHDFQVSIANLTGFSSSKVCYEDSVNALIALFLALKTQSKNKLLVSEQINPATLVAINSFAKSNDITLVTIESLGLATTNSDVLDRSIDESVFAVYVEQPNFIGCIEDLELLSNVCHNMGVILIAGVYPVALGAIKNPGELGVDVAIGDLQSIGLSLAFGGKTGGFICASEQILNQVNGEQVVKEGEEYQIKNSAPNHFNNQLNMATALSCFAQLSYLGEDGLKTVATTCASNAHYLNFALAKAGVGVKYKNEFFNEFVTLSKCTAENMLNALAQQGILGGYKVGTHEILWCATELNTREQMDKCALICGEVNR